MQHFPVDFGNAAHTMLLVDGRIFKPGKDVLLSYFVVEVGSRFSGKASEHGTGRRASKKRKTVTW